MSGVGISFGLDRIYLVMEELGLFPEEAVEGTKVLFINFGDTEAAYAMKAISALRAQGIAAELYPDKMTSGKQMKKQMTYANRRDIPFVILAGEQEVKDQTLTVKNMTEGTQETIDLKTLINQLSKA
jgi:histidyl-tRNA synthetase